MLTLPAARGAQHRPISTYTEEYNLNDDNLLHAAAKLVLAEKTLKGCKLSP